MAKCSVCGANAGLMNSMCDNCIKSEEIKRKEAVAEREREAAERKLKGHRVWEHTILVLKIKEKGFAVSRKDLLEGIADESRTALIQMGNDGWELVSVLPFMSGSVGMFSSSRTSTDSFLAFFKRQEF